MGESNIICKAIFLDDEQQARDQAKTFFAQHGVDLETPDTIEEFIDLYNAFPIVLCDFNLDNISSTNGVTLLREARKKNKDAVMAIYSALTRKITETEKNELYKIGISVYPKSDPANAIKNLKRDSLHKSIGKDKSNESFQQEHYNLNKEITLKHLLNLTNKNLKIPILKLNKAYSYTELLEEINKDSYIGNYFILEFMENISQLNEFLKKKKRW